MILNTLLRREDRRDVAALAKVSFSREEGYGAVAEGEYRTLAMAAPGGYAWKPRERDNLLVLRTGDGDFCAGVTSEPSALAPGEIKITGPGGSHIWLKADGTVVINGAVFGVGGTLTPPAEA